MINVATWFDVHLLAVTAYIEENQLSCKPDTTLCVLILFIHYTAVLSVIVCKFLKGHRKQL